jgi:hypothetical protein
MGIDKVTKRHNPIPGEGVGKGCCRRKGGDDKAYRENLDKILANKDEIDTSGFVVRINGEVVN